MVAGGSHFLPTFFVAILQGDTIAVSSANNRKHTLTFFINVYDKIITHRGFQIPIHLV